LSSVIIGPVKIPTCWPVTTATALPAARSSAFRRASSPRNAKALAGTRAAVPRISLPRAAAASQVGGSG
jgi:hypothetical protein